MLNALLLALPLVASGGQTSDTLEFVTLAAGGSHTCGITKSKAAYCWGSNQYGQIGDGKRTGQQDPNRYPTPVLGDHQFASLALGSRFSCGLTPEGKAYCWGYNYDGQIGDGTTTGEKFAPTAVEDRPDVRVDRGGTLPRVRAERKRGGLLLGQQRLGAGG